METVLTRTLGGVKITAATIRVRGDAWPVWVHTIVRIREERPHMTIVQNFTSIAQYRKYRL